MNDHEERERILHPKGMVFTCGCRISCLIEWIWWQCPLHRSADDLLKVAQTVAKFRGGDSWAKELVKVAEAAIRKATLVDPDYEAHS